MKTITKRDTIKTTALRAGGTSAQQPPLWGVNFFAPSLQAGISNPVISLANTDGDVVRPRTRSGRNRSGEPRLQIGVLINSHRQR